VNFISAGTILTSNLGIGTTTPVYELDVVGSSRVTTQQFIGFSNSNTGTLRFFAAGGTNYIQSGSNNTSGSGNTLTIGSINNITQTMTINTSTQRVGIGTTTPSYTLDVTGTISGNGGTIISSFAVNNSFINIKGSSSTEGFIFGQVQDESATCIANNFFYNNVSLTSTIGNSARGTAMIALGGLSGIRLFTNTTNQAPVERMRITQGGNVGIGSTNPAYLLDINGQIRTTNDSPLKPTGGSWIAYSDERIKTNIIQANTTQCYSIIKNIPLYHYKYIDSFYSTNIVNDKSRLGYLAQNVKTYFPKAVETTTGYGYDDLLTLDITQIQMAHYGATQHLISTVEEQSTIIQNQQIQQNNHGNIIHTLISSITNLQEELSTLKNSIAQQQAPSQPPQE
jgi:hypothetical protein